MKPERFAVQVRFNPDGAILTTEITGTKDSILEYYNQPFELVEGKEHHGALLEFLGPDDDGVTYLLERPLFGYNNTSRIIFIKNISGRWTRLGSS